MRSFGRSTAEPSVLSAAVADGEGWIIEHTDGSGGVMLDIGECDGYAFMGIGQAVDGGDGADVFVPGSPRPPASMAGIDEELPPFRYVPKASRSERSTGVEGWLWVKAPDLAFGWRRVELDEWNAAPEDQQGIGNVHATVKPVALMRWLLRLVVRPGGLVIDPFMGSGSTIVAAIREGIRAIGVELNGSAFSIAAARAAHTATTPERARRPTTKPVVKPADPPTTVDPSASMKPAAAPVAKKRSKPVGYTTPEHQLALFGG